MKWNSPTDAMPLVGLYVCVASLVCILAMAADAFQGFYQRKLWFPCKFFNMNAASITLIAITMKLSVDLSSKSKLSDHDPELDAKLDSVDFLVTMLANSLPSLGLLDDKELVMNIVSIGILLITVFGNIFIQATTTKFVFGIGILFTWIVPLSLPFLVALTVPVSRRLLQYQYKELHRLAASNHEEIINFSCKGLIHYVKKHWMMAETVNPQFVIACSPVSSALGVVCLYNACVSIYYLILLSRHTPFLDSKSDYKWSIIVIDGLQLVGIMVGSIAPIFRCLSATTHFNLSTEWRLRHIDVFRFTKLSTRRILLWNCSQVPSCIPGRHCKKVFHKMKNMLLNLCRAFQIMNMLVYIVIGSVASCCVVFVSDYCMPFLKRFTEESDASNSTVTSDIEEDTGFVQLIDHPEVKLSKRILRNALNSITQILHESEKKEPSNLISLLQKSTGFNGVVEFNNDQVPTLHPEETRYCWSLAVVTLTAIALALPNIADTHVKGFLAGMMEGVQFVRHIEQCLNADNDLLNARKTAGWVWTEVELYCRWLDIDLQKKRPTIESTSKEIIKWLGDEAAKIMIEFEINNYSLQYPRFIAASSMYRIGQTILLHCNEQENWPTDEELFEFISTIIADLLCACFTNLPRVITMKCHEDTLEKREDSIRIAAQLLGKSKRILKMLKARKLPNLDMDSMGYIDKWHASLRSQVPDGSSSAPSSSPASSSSNKSLVVTIM